MIRILIADDQPIVRTGLATLLAGEPDIEVRGEASDGVEAVRLVQRVPADVILMDVRMPTMDGIEATASIVRSGSACRVCVLTTYGTDEYLADALAAGCAGFLVKTDSPERIVATIRAIARGEFAMGAETTRRVVEQFVRRAAPDPSAGRRMATLTEREREVFTLIAEGLNNAEIAERLYVGEGTVKTHVAHILTKLGLRDRVQVAVFAHQNDLGG